MDRDIPAAALGVAASGFLEFAEPRWHARRSEFRRGRLGRLATDAKMGGVRIPAAGVCSGIMELDKSGVGGFTRSHVPRVFAPG